jgi:hypothetical protein
MLFKELIAAYSESHMKQINILWKKCSYCLLKHVVHIVVTKF